MPNNQRIVTGFLPRLDVKFILAAQALVIIAASAAAGWVAGAQMPTRAELISVARGQAGQVCTQAVAGLRATAKTDKTGQLTVAGRSGLRLQEAALEVSLLQTQCAGHELVSACLGRACDTEQGASYAIVLAPSDTSGTGE